MSVEPAEFRDAMARWPTGVTIVAIRHESRVVALTVSAFVSLSLDPPLVLVALGANANILPFLQTGARFGVSILGEQHRRLASIYADAFPVGPSPFPDEGDPLIEGAPVALACTVTETRQGGDHVVAVARVENIVVAGDHPPLIRYDRRYQRLRP